MSSQNVSVLPFAAPPKSGAKTKVLRAPSHFEKLGKKLWREIHEKYEIADPSAIAMLTAACEAMDRCEQARQLVQRDGLIIAGKFGDTVNPMCTLERQARQQMIVALKGMGVRYEPIQK